MAHLTMLRNGWAGVRSRGRVSPAHQPAQGSFTTQLRGRTSKVRCPRVSARSRANRQSGRPRRPASRVATVGPDQRDRRIAIRARSRMRRPPSRSCSCRAHQHHDSRPSGRRRCASSPVDFLPRYWQFCPPPVRRLLPAQRPRPRASPGIVHRRMNTKGVNFRPPLTVRLRREPDYRSRQHRSHRFACHPAHITWRVRLLSAQRRPPNSSNRQAVPALNLIRGR